MYHFVDLTEAQQLQRRQLLDRYALIAQFSALAPLVILNIFHFAEQIEKHRRARSGGDLETPPSSPYVKARGLNGLLPGGQDLSRKLRVWNWWAGDRLEIGGWELGTKGQVIAAGVWAGWLLVLSFAQTGDDYLHLTKRFGIVAASQLPLHYLLAAKTPSSPLQFLTRCSHETLNVFHQLLGRIVTTLLALHVILYFNFYIQSGLLLKKIVQFYIICGILGAFSFTAIGTTALQPVRRKDYHLFYLIHITLASALLPILYFHVSHIRIFLYETLAIYLASTLLRHLRTTKVSGALTLLPGTNLLSIRITNPNKPGLLTKWQPSQHAYISLPGNPVTRALRSNPFTNASVPATDGELRFVARVLEGNTAQLARAASANSNSGQRTSQAAPTASAPSVPLSLEGPYGVSSHTGNLLRAHRILLIAGGVGGTFVVPLYRQLLEDLSPSPGSLRRSRVTFVWVARAWSEVSWAFPAANTAGTGTGADREGLQREKRAFAERARICLTGEVPGEAAGRGRYAGDAVGEGVGTEEGAGFGGAGEEGIELEERKTLLADNDGDNGVEVGKNKVEQQDGGMKVAAAPSWGEAAEAPVYAGRPDLRRLVDQTFAHGEAERVAVVVCGPKGLGEMVRAEVGRWVGRGREVWFWNERFAL